MCYEAKCCMCCSVKTGCLVLAILNTIGIGMILLGSVISYVLFAKTTYEMSSYLDFGLNIAIRSVILIIGVPSLIAFIFSVLLCNGICNRRPGQVQAYFIFGVVMTAPAVLIALGYVMFNPIFPGPGLVLLVPCAIYSLFLRLVHQTYFVLLEEAAPKHYVHPAAMQHYSP